MHSCYNYQLNCCFSKPPTLIIILKYFEYEYANGMRKICTHKKTMNSTYMHVCMYVSVWVLHYCAVKWVSHAALHPAGISYAIVASNQGRRARSARVAHVPEEMSANKKLKIVHLEFLKRVPLLLLLFIYCFCCCCNLKMHFLNKPLPQPAMLHVL